MRSSSTGAITSTDPIALIEFEARTTWCGVFSFVEPGRTKQTRTSSRRTPGSPSPTTARRTDDVSAVAQNGAYATFRSTRRDRRRVDRRGHRHRLCAVDPKAAIVLSPRAPPAAAHPGVWVASDNPGCGGRRRHRAAGPARRRCPRRARRAYCRPHRRVIQRDASPDVAAISRLLGPVAEVSRGKPAVSVANRAGLTPVSAGWRRR